MKTANDQIRAKYLEVVETHGRVQGQPLWVPYYWDAALEGDGDTSGGTTRFTVDPEEAELFPELKVGDFVDVWETTDGFVKGSTSAPGGLVISDEMRQINDDLDEYLDRPEIGDLGEEESERRKIAQGKTLVSILQKLTPEDRIFLFPYLDAQFTNDEVDDVAFSSVVTLCCPQ